MLGKLLPVLFLVVGLGAGVGAGVFLGPKPSQDSAHASYQASDHGEEKPSKAKPGDQAKSEPSEDHDAEDSGNEYVKMNKPFVVPLVHKDQISGLATVSLSLEVQPGFSENFYAKEPKLRDGFLQVLFDHANIGGFDGAFTRPGNLDPLRVALLESAQKAFGDNIVSVLIVDIARQDSY